MAGRLDERLEENAAATNLPYACPIWNKPNRSLEQSHLPRRQRENPEYAMSTTPAAERQKLADERKAAGHQSATTAKSSGSWVEHDRR
jgi:hypothetical protein